MSPLLIDDDTFSRAEASLLGSLASNTVSGSSRDLRERLDYHTTEYRTLRAATPDDALRRLIAPCQGRVLDVGCGFGQMLFSLPRWGGPDLMVGIDLDMDLLGFGARLGAEMPSGERPPRLVGGDALRLPFVAGSFDLVICRVVLMALPVKAAVLEMARVVAPGGRLYLQLTGPGFYLEDLARGRWTGRARSSAC